MIKLDFFQSDGSDGRDWSDGSDGWDFQCILNRVAVKADLERSLKTRLLMHSEGLLKYLKRRRKKKKKRYSKV